MSTEIIPAIVTTVSGSITANSGQTVTLPVLGYGSVGVMVFGTYGSVANTFQISHDGGTTWDTFQMVRNNTNTVETTTGSLSNTTRSWTADVAGATHFRLLNSAWTSGTQSIRIAAIPSATNRFTSAQQSGTWNIGTVTTVTTVSTLTSITNTVTVSGTVSISSGTVTVSNTVLGNAGACSIGKFEDSGHGTGDTGVFILAVRNDTADNVTVDANTDYIQLSTDNVGALRVSLPSSSRSDTFTSTTNGTTVTRTSSHRSKFGLQVVQTGTVTSWDVRLEGSLDGTNFTTILTQTNVDGSGVVKWSTTDSPCLYFRSRCAGLVLGAGTNVIATILGTQ